jgi:hypothetical protein
VKEYRKKPFMWITRSSKICGRKRKALGSLTEQGKTKRPQAKKKEYRIYTVQKREGWNNFQSSSIGGILNG